MIEELKKMLGIPSGPEIVYYDRSKVLTRRHGTAFGPPEDRWTQLHARSRLRTRNNVRELRWIADLASGLPEGCSCRTDWADYLVANPPTIESPSEYELWAVAAHNAVNQRLGKPVLTPDEARQAQGLHVHHTANGLGDAICGVYAVCGLADVAGVPIVYHARSSDWLTAAGVSHPGLRIVPNARLLIGADLNNGNAGYSDQIRTATSRCQRYCDNLAKAYGLPPFQPRRPASLP